MALFGIDFSAIFDAVKRFLGPFGQILDKAKEAITHVTNIISASTKLRDSIVGEIDGWKNFKEDIRLKQRAIVLETAITKTRELIEGIPEAWRSLLDIFKQVKAQFTEVSGGNAIEEAEAAAEEVEAGGIKSLLTRFPRLAKGLEKILGVLAIVVDALEKVANLVDDLQTIVDELKRVRLEIEKLDTIFLSQSNKRKTLRLEDGRTIRIRVGKLHSTS